MDGGMDTLVNVTENKTQKQTQKVWIIIFRVCVCVFQGIFNSKVDSMYLSNRTLLYP